MREENVNNHRKTGAADRAGTGMQDCPAAQQGTRREGLRILARIIARAHLRRQVRSDAPRPDL